MTYEPSRRSLWRDIMDVVPPTTVADEPKTPGAQEKLAPNGMKKYRVYPTTAQQATIKMWLGAVRWTYNKAVAYLNDDGTKGARTIKQLRACCVNDETISASTRSSWVGCIPYDVRDEGVRDAQKALGSNMAKQRLRKKHGLPFSFALKYRRLKRSFQQTLVIHSKHWLKTRGLYYDLLGRAGNKLRSAEPLPAVLTYDIRLTRTRLNEYYLCVPMANEVYGDNQAVDESMPCTVAMDPGVRTFMTTYDASGRVVEWGAGDMTRIHRLCLSINSLEKCWTKEDCNHRLRYRLKRAALRIRRRIRRMVDEIHRKLIKWLCSNFRVILIPVFETQQMIRRRNGRSRLNSQTAKDMLTWSHFRFRTNLKHKALMFPATYVVETTEEYTSKTCGICGVINQKLGSKKVFTCGACAHCSDRDFNGARNILIRHLTVNRVSP